MKTRLKSGSSFEIVSINNGSLFKVNDDGSVTIAGTAVATQSEVPTKISDLTNDSDFLDKDDATLQFVTNNGATTTNVITVNYTETGTQQSAMKVLSTYDAVTDYAGWRGRLLVGANNKTFLMGTYKGLCVIGAHGWTSAAAGTGAAWEDIYFNPDGSAKIYLGNKGFIQNSGVLKIENPSSNSVKANTAYLNEGTLSSPTWSKLVSQSVLTSALSDLSTYVNQNFYTQMQVDTTLSGYDTSDVVDGKLANKQDLITSDTDLSVNSITVTTGNAIKSSDESSAIAFSNWNDAPTLVSSDCSVCFSDSIDCSTGAHTLHFPSPNNYVYEYHLPEKDGTLATLDDIPSSGGPIYCHQITVSYIYNEYSSGYFTLYNSSPIPITTYAGFVAALPVGRTLGSYYGYSGPGFCSVFKGATNSTSLSASFFVASSTTSGAELTLAAAYGTAVNSSSQVTDTVTQI